MVKKWPFLKLKFSVFYFQNWKTHLWKKIVIYVIEFDPIGIYICLALQNDQKTLNFVKDICVVGKKRARNGWKMTKDKVVSFFPHRLYKIKLIEIDSIDSGLQYFYKLELKTKMVYQSLWNAFHSLKMRSFQWKINLVSLPHQGRPRHNCLPPSIKEIIIVYFQVLRFH